MFTNRDKIKELVRFFADDKSTQCLAFENTHYKPVGVSIVVTYQYTIKDTEVVYNKWFVDCFDKAKIMGLPGTEHHNKLVKGSGVTVSSKRLGNYTFYGDEAKSLIDACELNRDLTSQIIFHHQSHR